MDEMLRLITALLATPVEWKKGDKVIVPPATTADLLRKELRTIVLGLYNWHV